MPAHRRFSGGVLLSLIAGLALVAACTGDDDTPDPEPDPTSTASPGEPIGLVISDVPRNATSSEATASVAAANNAFATNLYAALAEGHTDNLVFSPYSAAVALAMTLEGARGDTATEMADVLHAELAGGAEGLGSGFNGLEELLAEIPGEYPVGDDQVVLDLSTANQLFGQQGFGFEQPFLDRLAAEYGAGMRLVDYATAAEDARGQINDWVGDQTRDRIPELIPQGAIDADTRLVLTNAIYLNAPWMTPFEEGATDEGSFTRLDGSEVTADFMHQNAHFGYAEGDGFQVVELPYAGGRISMLVVLPDAGSFDAVESGLDAPQLAALRESLLFPKIELSFPRFEFHTQSGLKPVLADLGMPTAFTEQADFSGITSEAPVLISDVLHEAFISVDEEGTEAAAATAVIVSLTSAPLDPPPVVTVDRPFLFLIQERETGTVLFMGRVMDPTAD